ncbi:MAG TPA: hypothetical protein PLE88_12520, partial [Anaerohalosphaeraceae bacterium]|nr:hypothetical protein [Anaerohalosphaeraceae bacterium]
FRPIKIKNHGLKHKNHQQKLKQFVFQQSHLSPNSSDLRSSISPAVRRPHRFASYSSFTV